VHDSVAAELLLNVLLLGSRDAGARRRGPARFRKELRILLE
jgi:hypothetical protein